MTARTFPGPRNVAEAVEYVERHGLPRRGSKWRPRSKTDPTRSLPPLVTVRGIGWRKQRPAEVVEHRAQLVTVTLDEIERSRGLRLELFLSLFEPYSLDDPLSWREVTEAP